MMGLHQMKRMLSGLLATLMLITSLPITAYADDYNGTGGGSSGGSTGGGLTWTSTKQGYRVTIVDKDANIVAAPVDFVYEALPNNTLVMANSKLEQFNVSNIAAGKRNAVYLISEVMKSEGFNPSEPWPSAMIWTFISSLGKEGPLAQGETVKKWMMSGEFIKGSYPTNGSGGSGGSAPSGGSNSGSKPSGGGSTTTKPPAGNGGSSSTPTKPPAENNNTGTSGGNKLPDGFTDGFKPLAPLAEYKREYRKLITDKAKQYKSYGYSKSAFSTALSNYIKQVVNPKIDSLKLTASEKEAIKLAVLDEYRVQITSGGWIDLPTTGTGSSAKRSSATPMAYNMSNFQVGEDVIIPDEIVPLASGAEENDGYILPLLNYKSGGQYVFKLNGEDNSAAGKGRGEIIAQKGYRVMIEPIIWYIPLTKDKASYGRYVYGTITNQAQWSQYMKSHGFDDSNLWHYGNITRKVGGWSLYIEKDEVFTGKTIKTPKDNFNNTIAVSSLADINNGYALHIYRASAVPGESETQTYDPPQGKLEHPAPDPGDIPLSEGEKPEDRKINIVKTYQNNGEHVVTYYRTTNPKTIRIMDEPEYKVEEWYKSKTYNNPTQDTTWAENHAQAAVDGGSGTRPATVQVLEPSTTLYVLLVKKDEAEIEGDLIIRESQVTKAVETINGSIPNWGPKTMNFEAPDISGSCPEIWYCSDDDCGGHRCGAPYVMQDTSWNYNHKNTEAIDKLIHADVGNFKAINARGADATGNRGSVSTYSNSVNTFNYKLVVWRGQDIPTTAAYKEKSGHELNTLTTRYGKTPQGERYNGKEYTAPLKITLDKDAGLGDYITTSVTDHGYSKSATHSNLNTLNYDAIVKVEVYWGKAHQLGNLTATGSQPIQTVLIGKPSQPKYSGGQMKQSDKDVTWYPYIRMTYQTTGKADTDRTNVNILSQWLSELTPNDYVEAAWVADSDYNMNIRSSQWSIHNRATSGDKGWNYPNRVLPGGAIYSLDTMNNKTWASIVTWQPYLEEEVRTKVVIEGTEFTYDSTKAPHDAFVAEATKALEDWRIVQYVKDFKSFDGKTEDLRTNKNTTLVLDGVKIAGGGQTLSGLTGLTGKTNTEDKYYMKPASTKEAANEGDIDILKVSTIEVKYKVTADVEGKIHVYRERDGSGWIEICTLDKNVGADGLYGEALTLDQRTKIITNLCTVLTRNAGNDKTASWAKSDGKWYNEAFDGICYTRRETSFELGYKAPNQRTAALDPALCPPNSGQSDLFKNAFLSQFFMNDKSDAYPSKPDGFIGSFKGLDVKLAGYKEMFKTVPFSIPNVNVQDLS